MAANDTQPAVLIRAVGTEMILERLTADGAAYEPAAGLSGKGDDAAVEIMPDAKQENYTPIAVCV